MLVLTLHKPILILCLSTSYQIIIILYKNIKNREKLQKFLFFF